MGLFVSNDANEGVRVSPTHADCARKSVSFAAARTFLFCLCLMPSAFATPHSGTASYYTRASCSKEGTSGVMANGQKLEDKTFTAASWDYPFGTLVRVCKGIGQSCVTVTITDRGPAKRLYRTGRIIDLSQAAFQALAPLSQGIIVVTVEVL